MTNSDDDILRPNTFASSRVSISSLSTWRALLSSGHSMTHLPTGCSNIKSLLNHTPSIPGPDQAIEVIGNSSVFLEGYSSWSISTANTRLNPDCELPPSKQAPPREVLIGESRPGACTLSREYISEWPGLQPSPSSAGNYLAVFVLGWSYIFSARLVEVRRGTAQDGISYTENMAHMTHDIHKTTTEEYFDLDIGCDSLSAVRWWAAILAGGRGWQATISRHNETTHFSPWESHLETSYFRICYNAESESLPSANMEAPSSAEALEYLYNMARKHDVFDQLICAFAATMTLPSHNRFVAPVTLPKPLHGHGPRQDQNTERIYSDQIPTLAEISHYLTFSGVSGLLTSCLLGSFWEPGIPCNLASEWLNPALSELTATLFKSKQYIPVVWAMSERRPNVASLWLGAAITGLLPRILQVSKGYLPPIYPEAVAWTDSPQSFMDPANYRYVKSRRIGDRAMIPREDEFRLLYLTDCLSDDYRHPPICPYPPFGEVNLQDTSLEVRLHFSCNHRISYRSWEWKGVNGHALSDFGISPYLRPSRVKSIFSSSLAIWLLTGFVYSTTVNKSWMMNFICRTIWPNVRQAEEESSNDRLSAAATRALFLWTFYIEGTRTEDRAFWNHEWLESFLEGESAYSGESNLSEIEGEGEGEAKPLDFESIERWRADTEAKDLEGLSSC
ncbi:hypothetical protein N7456_001474 [Penicillium angulare]|uniref:Uncharacterized protein n=1 Tax=Penicillium angulare TaxID=116970 RepID=A0A9W9G793_9EURO|nr:hypothetical protein N7456_001474 [Penicillium angulare]